MIETAATAIERYIGKNSRCRISPWSSGLLLDHGAEVIACVRASGQYVAEARRASMPVSRCTARPRNKAGRCGGAARLRQGAGRFSPSSRSRPERTGRRWTSSLGCSFRGGPEGPELAGAVRGCCWSHAGSGEVQPEFQVATGANGAAVDSSLDVPSEADPRARSWRGRCGGAAGLTQGAGRFSPSSSWRPERTAAEVVFVIGCSFRGGREGPKMWGAVRGARSHPGAGRFTPQFQLETGANRRRRWCSSSGVPSEAGARPEDVG